MVRLSTDDFVESPARFFQREPEPELLFNNIPVSKKNEYRVKLFDFGNPVSTCLRGTSSYWVWKGELLSGFGGIGLDYSLKYWIHFPSKSFMIAYELVPGYRKIVPDEIMDCVLSFRRVSKKKLVITDRKYLATDVRR